MLRLAVRVRREHAELVLAELLELAPAGVEEVALDAETIEYAVYGAPGELPALPDLEVAAGSALVHVSTSEIADDWAERWREFHQPLVLGERLTVRPPWSPTPEVGVDVVIDPGQAFGTGAHPTTRLCLELMLELPATGSFLDLGCGSGVLAIAAAKLGWGPVAAVDNDAASIEAARENAVRNGAEIEVKRWDLRTDSLPVATTLAANLLRPPLLTLAGRISVGPRRLIASGLLREEADELATAFANAGLHERQRRTSGEWAALLLESERG